MANFGLGLAQGFSIGTQLGEALRKRRMRDQFEEAQKEKPYERFTKGLGEELRTISETTDETGNLYQVRPTKEGLGYDVYKQTRDEKAVEDMRYEEALRNARDAEGRPYYNVEINPDGTRSVRPLVSTEGGGFATRNLASEYPYQIRENQLAADAEALQREEEMLRPVVQPRLEGLTREELVRTLRPDQYEYLGKQFAQMPTEAQQRSGLMNRYAQILSEYDPIEGEKFRSMARAEDRAQETFDLTKQLSKLQIDQAARTGRIDAEVDKASQIVQDTLATNPTATPAQLVDAVRKNTRLPPDKLNSFVASVAGIDEADLKFMNNSVERSLRKVGGSIDGLLKEFNDNPLFDPSTNVNRVVGKDGKVTLNFVSADDPNKVLSTYSFKNDLEARDFLINSARNPGQQAEWMSKMRAQEAQARYYEGRADYYERGGGQRAGRDYSVQDNARISTALTGQRNSILRQIADQDEIINGMGDKEEKDRAKKVRQALAGQLDTIDVAIADVNSQLTGRGGLSRGGGGGTEPKPKVGQTYVLPNPKTGEDMYVRLKEGDGSKEEDWEILEYKRSRGGKTISGPITRPGEKLPTVDEDKKKK
jgi:methylphosphotriester-DNA--protein-cysteine methyltransferase